MCCIIIPNIYIQNSYYNYYNRREGRKGLFILPVFVPTLSPFYKKILGLNTNYFIFIIFYENLYQTEII